MNLKSYLGKGSLLALGLLAVSLSFVVEPFFAWQVKLGYVLIGASAIWTLLSKGK